MSQLLSILGTAGAGGASGAGGLLKMMGGANPLTTLGALTSKDPYEVMEFTKGQSLTRPQEMAQEMPTAQSPFDVYKIFRKTRQPKQIEAAPVIGESSELQGF